MKKKIPEGAAVAMAAAMLLSSQPAGAVDPVDDDIWTEETRINVDPVVTVEGSHIDAQMTGGVEYIWGSNTYQIGYPVQWADGSTENGYFPFSELKFPVDAAVASVGVGIEAYKKYQLNATYKFDVSEPNGNMEDSDWITPENPGQLDIYSESTVKNFDFYSVDVDAAYRFYEDDARWLSGGAGYLYQHYRYDCHLITQGSPSGYEGFDYVGDGRTALIYTLDHSIPYLQFRGGLSVNDKFDVNGRVGFSPLVNTKDRDEHTLRHKENQGDMDGYAWMLSVLGKYTMTEHVYMTAGAEFMSVDVDGKSDASFFGWYDHTVTEELESRQASANVNIGYKF